MQPTGPQDSVQPMHPEAQNYSSSGGYDDSDFTMPAEKWNPGFGESPDTGKGGSIEGSKGVYEGTMIPVDGEIIISRDETCAHVVIKGPEISRKHCGIAYDKGTGSYLVTDYSSNGVYDKNGQEFPKGVPVACGVGTIIVIAESGNEFLLK